MLTTLKSTLAAAFAVSALAVSIIPNAYADNYLAWGKNTRAIGPVLLGTKDETYFGTIERFNSLNNTYLGNAGYQSWWSGPNIKYAQAILPGYQKRPGVFKMQTMDGGNRTDLVFNSKLDADAFCSSLNKIAFDTENIAGDPITVYISSDFLHANDKAIAVAYWIAYDTGSKPRADGTSEPVQRHVICPNPWEWKPDARWNDENESTGIRYSSLEGSTYHVVCMDTRKQPKTFQVNGGTLHAHNATEGAQYCPLS